MNRTQRRKLEKKGIVQKFDPETQGRVKFSIDLPPGLLRDDSKSSRSGSFTADNEVDLTRGMFVKMLESFGYVNQQHAVVGLFASVVNPFPKNMRGALAYAIINGTGLQVVEEEVEVCVRCEAEKQATIDLEAEVPDEDACLEMDGDESCGYSAGDDVHDLSAEGDAYLHDFETADPTMKDTTVHDLNCPCRPLNEEEETTPGKAREVQAATWKEITAVLVLTPVMYEPLNTTPDETEGKVEIEDDGSGITDDEEPINTTVEDEALDAEKEHDLGIDPADLGDA